MTSVSKLSQVTLGGSQMSGFQNQREMVNCWLAIPAAVAAGLQSCPPPHTGK